MPTGVPIQSIPNQSLSISLGGNLFALSIRETAGVMSVSVALNNVDIVTNSRAAACSPIIPAQYLEAGSGNFMFLTANNQLPYYSQFNASQALMYFTAEELAAYRAAPPARVTASFFNPIAQLPLRFSPVGYTEAT